MEALNPEAMREAFRQLLPCPCRTRYTAITMMPQPPNLVQRLAFKCSSMLARFTGGSGSGWGGEEEAAALGRGLQRSVSRAGSGRLVASADSAGLAVPVGEEPAAAAVMGQGGHVVGGSRDLGRQYGTGYYVIGGVAVATAALAVGAVVWGRSRRSTAA